MTRPTEDSPASGQKKTAKQRLLEDALRANLLKRKSQQRARASTEEPATAAAQASSTITPSHPTHTEK